MTAPPRLCVICGKPLPPGSRADRRTDTERCRQALHRRQQLGHRDPIDDLRALVAEAADELADRGVADDLAERLRGAVQSEE